MFGLNARQLAVASLTEAGDAATALWRRDGRPLQGYVLVTGEGADCRVTVYLQQGEGSHTAVLAGDMVWFQSPAVGAAESHEAPGAGDPAPGTKAAGPQDGPAQAPEPGPVPEPGTVTEEDERAEVGFKLYPEPATPVAAFPPHKIEVIVTPVEEGAGNGPPPAPTEAPPPPAGGAGAPDEPAPASADTPIPLLSRHPQAPRAGGTVRIDPHQGRLTIAVRGLPSPAHLNPAYNAYRAWLLSQRAGTREPIGYLTRAWGENYRLEAAADLPFSRFDAIIITAEDRRATIENQNPPQVLFGAYR